MLGAVRALGQLADEPYPDPPYASPPFPPHRIPARRLSRTSFNLTAARGELVGLPGLTFANPDEARLALPEKHLAARVRHDGAEVDGPPDDDPSV